MSFWIDVPEEENTNITYNEVVALMNAHESEVTEQLEELDETVTESVENLTEDLTGEETARATADTVLQNAIEENAEDIAELDTTVSAHSTTLTSYGTRLTSLEDLYHPCNGVLKVWSCYPLGYPGTLSAKTYLHGGEEDLVWTETNNFETSLYSYSTNTGIITFKKKGYVLASGQFHVSHDTASTSFSDYSVFRGKLSLSNDAGVNWADVGGTVIWGYCGVTAMRCTQQYASRVFTVDAGTKVKVVLSADDTTLEPFIGNNYSSGLTRFEFTYLSYED